MLPRCLNEITPVTECYETKIYSTQLSDCKNVFMLPFTAYTLEYDNNLSPPPSVPLDPKERVYSVAINSMTSRPLKAYVKDASNNVPTTDDFYNVLQFQVQTLDVNAVSNPAYVDTWLNSGGYLTMWGRQAPVPGRIQRKYFK